jgi:hypothetical protein
MNPSDADPVLIDATLVRNFHKRGFRRYLPQYFGDRAYFVRGVRGELDLEAEVSETLRLFLDDWPSHEVLDLPPDLLLLANDWIDFYRGTDEHEQINRGEIETYVMARHLIDQGQQPLIISDDGLAKDLCRGKESGRATAPYPGDQVKVPSLDTPNLILQMVCAGVLPKVDGKKVWHDCFSNPKKWKEYEPSLARMCGM